MSIELTKQQINILGTPNFIAAPMAKILIKAGLYADGGKKVEYEQAVYIHWATGLLDEHGENWRQEAIKIFEGLDNVQ